MDLFYYKYTDIYIYTDITYYWYVDDVDGDNFVLDIKHARIFTSKQIDDFSLDESFTIGEEIYCEEKDEFIILNSLPVKVKV